MSSLSEVARNSLYLKHTLLGLKKGGASMKSCRRLTFGISICFGMAILAGCADLAGPAPPVFVVLEQNEAVVLERLMEIGYSREEAIERTASMSRDELVFFGQNPEAIERTGFIIIGALLVSSSASSSAQNNSNKESAEAARRNEKALADLQREIERDRQLRRIEDLERMIDASGSAETKEAQQAAEVRRLREELERRDRVAELEAELAREEREEERDEEATKKKEKVSDCKRRGKRHCK